MKTAPDMRRHQRSKDMDPTRSGTLESPIGPIDYVLPFGFSSAKTCFRCKSGEHLANYRRIVRKRSWQSDSISPHPSRKQPSGRPRQRPFQGWSTPSNKGATRHEDYENSYLCRQNSISSRRHSASCCGRHGHSRRNKPE